MITNKELTKSWLFELLALVERTSNDCMESSRIETGITTTINVTVLRKDSE